MSTDLHWKPTGNGKRMESNTVELKNALRRGLGEGPWTLADCDLGFLRGLRAAGIDGADELIRFIEEHGSIDVREQG